jgi:hypothetical protein
VWLRRRVRRELQPLTDLSQALARYEPLPPGTPLAPATHAELQAVQDAITALGQRLARRVANERAFSAHAAHALRTPLAGIDTQLAVAQREAPDAMQPRLARVREAAGRLTRVVSALLALFRSGRRTAVAGSRPAGACWPACRTKGWTCTARRRPAAGRHRPADGDPDQPDGQRRAPRARPRRDAPGRVGRAAVPAPARRRPRRGPERRADLADALDHQAYEGRMGLGLMLADLVARAHGGRLTLPVVDTGFAVELQFDPPTTAEGPAAT